MIVEPLRGPGPWSVEFPMSLTSLLLLVGGLALWGYTLWRWLSNSRNLTGRRLVTFLVLLVVLVPAQRFFAVSWAGSRMVTPGPVTVVPFRSSVSLVAMVIIAGLAYAFGSGPGLIAGLVSGLALASYIPLIPTDILALSSWGGIIGVLLHQRYRGDVFRALRQPLVAVPLASFVTVLLLSLSRLGASRLDDVLQFIDFVVVLWRHELPLWIVLGFGVGAVYQAVALNPAWRLPQEGNRPSFYGASLRGQFMALTVPLVILSTLFSLLAVTNHSVNLARDQLHREMARSAAAAGEIIRQFYITGNSLIEESARQPGLLTGDALAREDIMETARRVVPFFHQLLLVEALPDDAFAVVAAAPAGVGGTTLTVEETNALRMVQLVGVGTRATPVTELPLGNGEASSTGYSVVAAVRGDAPDAGESGLYLIGRATFEDNHHITGAVSVLQKTRVRRGEEVVEYAGFLVDAYDWVVAHPNPRLVRTLWTRSDATDSYPLDAVDALDIAYEGLTVEGEHVLVHVHALEGIPLRVVVESPYLRVLETASQSARSLLLVQLLFGSILLVAIPVLSSRITRPLNAVSLAADRIAHGNLSEAVAIRGEDEVARLGDAFEQMRVHLQARLNDLSLLLDVSQQVSATLNLERGIVPILEGALTESAASVARFIILRDAGKQSRVFSVGENGIDYGKIDRGLAAAMVHRKDPLVIHDLTQAQPETVDWPELQTVAAFPVRSQENRTVAVLWVGGKRAGAFDEARVNFLSTLAGQAAVLMENARLFQTAEGGRQRLAAILASTRDAILVVDADGRLVLSNPAAQHVLGLDRAAVGSDISQLALPEPLVRALAAQTTTVRRVRRYQLAFPQSLRGAVGDSSGDPALPSVEVPLDDGRTYAASVAPIRGDDGVTVGVVVVMRDVTHFKEIDEMKSEFVATVSHDLRAPLTFMRGYTTMLSMVGDLNERQRDYMQRILDGIEQMNALIGDLLDLRRVEAGVGIRREPCRMGLVMVEAVEAIRGRASAKGVDLRLEPSEGSPTVMGDRTLLRQAVTNLVDNAVKYTPSGGEVTVGLDVTEDTATVRVTDTGIGIAPPDQSRLFEMFYRIKRREAGSTQGTGLGLALVKSIVERHGGRVWVESALNHGSTFFIELPLPHNGEPGRDA